VFDSGNGGTGPTSDTQPSWCARFTGLRPSQGGGRGIRRVLGVIVLLVVVLVLLPTSLTYVSTAQAEAKANQLLNRSLTSTLVQYEMAKGWDGKMPQVASSAIPLLQLAKH